MLSRELAERGHYPAIDIGRSVSRCMSQLTAAEHAEAARARGAWSRYQEVRSLIPLGGYVASADADTDRAVRLMPRLEAFAPGAVEAASYEDNRNGLMEMLAT